MQFFETKNHYNITVSDVNIKRKIVDIVNQCRDNYWISWLVIDKDSLKKRYHFKEVMGCNSKGKTENDCSFSVKETRLNPFYNKLHHALDNKTYEFLSDMDTGMVAYFEDMSELKDYKAIEEALKSTNEEVKSLGLTVTKDIKRNIIYAFTMTKTQDTPETCSKNEIVTILENLSKYAKKEL